MRRTESNATGARPSYSTAVEQLRYIINMKTVGIFHNLELTAFYLPSNLKRDFKLLQPHCVV